MTTAGPPRERIIREATRILAHGAQPSVADIAKAAGVSRTTFYRTFPSRAGLLEALELAPEPGARQRALEVALRLLRTQTLANLSMDELAVESGISRANLYRLFPGKTALFRAILIAFSPFEPVMALFDRLQDRPPEDVVPELVLTAYRTVAGRAGIARTLLLEATSRSPEFEQAFRETALRAFGRLAQYLAAQMAAGRLRRMHPMVAGQGLVGGVMFHVLIGPLLGQAMVDGPNGEEVVTQFANLWLRGMRPQTPD
ncbi:MAG: TetR family transcriptional regulator [Chloroflexi bacterium]|nr:MAG: TetR family transcriptional regulator [Chloroflexota bacterium]